MSKMDEIIIGKYTLESLTNGMYASSFDLYREYVQNAADSIDDAVNREIIRKSDAKISIEIDHERHRISILDNGTGIEAEKAEKILLDIGNSRKDRNSNRGFRGIGRLAGLGYCDRLRFVTSYVGELKCTQITFDAKLLREKLRATETEEESLFDVLNAVTEVNIFDEKEKNHYFLVEMEGVDETSKIMMESVVRDYLVQNLPLEYKPSFHWGKIITKKIASIGYEIPDYPIFLKCSGNEERLYKCYADTFVSDRVKRYVKAIDDIEILPFSINGKLSAILWFAKVDYSGTVLDEQIKGIRIRQGNLLIGNKYTTNQYFKEGRFNGWLLGELFVLDENMIPNARRDDFEETLEYIELKSQLLVWSASISKEIRKISLDRSANAEKKKAIDAVFVQEDENNLLVENIGFANDDDEIIGEVDESSYVADNALFDKFQILLGQKSNNYKYKVLSIRDDIPHEQRRILEKILDTLYSIYPKRKAETIAEDLMKNYK